MSSLYFKLQPLTLVTINTNACMRFGFVETCHGTLTVHGEIQEYTVRVYDKGGWRAETHTSDTIADITFDVGLHRIAKNLGIFDAIKADIAAIEAEVKAVEAEDAAPAQAELKAS
jgi:hypothetical protein